MKIAISGGTGFIGKQLSDYLLRSGHELILISRSDLTDAGDQLTKIINSADVIINLAGSSVLCRWTGRNKRHIIDSRVQTTRKLVQVILNSMIGNRPKIFISASAIGIYENSGVHDEFSSALSTGFLASVCKAWENETIPLKGLKLRLCTLRIGVVLGTTGGSLGKMLPLLKTGFGGKIGSGRQPFSFIHILDFCRAIEHLIWNDKSMGIYNLVSPQPTTNGLFTQKLSGLLHRPSFLTVPGFALRLIYGDAAELLTEGQCVKPARLVDEGFQFKFPDICSTLSELLKKTDQK